MNVGWTPGPDDIPAPRTLVLSGGKEGLGTTTLAVNFAVAMAAHGLRTLLIDADLYRADVAGQCGLPESTGIGDVLAGRKSIHEVLDMTVEDALAFFNAVPTIATKLQTLMDVGLSYVRLGQNATTLSGGEAQRVKLAKELSKRSTGRTIYILDEPTTGLHFFDIEQLLKVLHRLRDEGNTIVVIEHNLDVIKTADWIIDLGPEGGSGGGQIIAVGTPEQVAKDKKSHTGHYLVPVLERAKKRKS